MTEKGRVGEGMEELRSRVKGCGVTEGMGEKGKEGEQG